MAYLIPKRRNFIPPLLKSYRYPANFLHCSTRLPAEIHKILFIGTVIYTPSSLFVSQRWVIEMLLLLLSEARPEFCTCTKSHAKAGPMCLYDIFIVPFLQ